MKLTLVLLTAAMLQVSAKGISQTVSISGKNIALQEAFDVVTRQTGYTVFCKHELLQNTKKVSVNLKNANVEAAMEEILKGQNLSFVIVEKTIVVKEKQTAAFQPAANNIVSAAPPPIDVTGKILNEKGEPVEGVSITVKGTKKGVSTNVEGSFSIDVNIGDILVISCIGYAKREIKVSNGANISIVLARSKSPLDEVQIIAYGTTTKRMNIGSISTVKANEIQRQPVPNVLLALQGLVPGLDVTNSTGTPGAPVQVRLRGINTMNDVNKTVAALVLVDGVPVDDFSFLSPADIESVDVLKDASATAIYGSRGAAGVILITTKKGKMTDGSGKLSFQAYTSMSKPTHTARMLNAEEYRTLRKEAFANDGVDITPSNAPDLFLDDKGSTDWSRELYKTAFTQDYQLNVTGGSQRINYYLSGGYRNENAIVPGNWYQRRINTRMGLDAKVTDHLTIGGGIGFSRLKGRAYRGSIAANIYYASPLIPSDSAGIPNIKAYPSPLINPNRTLNVYTLSEGSQFLGNFYFNYNIWDKLYFRTDISYQQVNGTSTNFQPTTSTLFANSSTAGYPFGSYGYDNSGRLTVEPQLNYTVVLRKHHLRLLAGGTVIDGLSRSTNFNMTGFSNDLLPTLELATTLSSKTYSQVPYKFASAYGRASYNYDGRYLLEGVFRRDGSSRFGPNLKYGNFWSAGAGWVFSNEPFLQRIFHGDFFGKLKATYGVAGSDGITDFGYIAYSNSSIYNNNVATYINNQANPFLQWEQTSKLDLGLELALFRGRLNITVDYFSHRSNNTLFSQALSVVTGFGSMAANLDGLVTNRGVEITIAGDIAKSGNFNWYSQFNISTLSNKLRNLPGLGSLPPFARYQYRVGEPLALVWGLRYMGIDPATGLAVFEDKDKSNTIATYTDDMQVLGKTIADFYGGWNNTLTYEGWELNLQIQFLSGILKSYNTYTSFIGDAYNLPIDALGRWQKPNDITNVPRATAPGTPAAINNAKLISSSYAFSDASYIRVKNISVGYTFPRLGKQHISSLRVFLTGYNLITITGYKGNDPESGPTLVPVTKTYTAGVNIIL